MGKCMIVSIPINNILIYKHINVQALCRCKRHRKVALAPMGIADKMLFDWLEQGRLCVCCNSFVGWQVTKADCIVTMWPTMKLMNATVFTKMITWWAHETADMTEFAKNADVAEFEILITWQMMWQKHVHCWHGMNARSANVAYLAWRTCLRGRHAFVVGCRFGWCGRWHMVGYFRWPGLSPLGSDPCEQTGSTWSIGRSGLSPLGLTCVDKACQPKSMGQTDLSSLS